MTTKQKALIQEMKVTGAAYLDANNKGTVTFNGRTISGNLIRGLVNSGVLKYGNQPDSNLYRFFLVVE